jgi:translation initiation factor IF-2
MARTSESSVMVALGELRQLESERLEAAAAARRDAEERARRDRELAAERERARAEHDEALRFAREARSTAELDAARDRSLDDLRARVAAIAAERAALEAELRARVERAASPETVGSRGPWALAFGASSLIAAALAGALVLVAQPPRETAAAPPIGIERIAPQAIEPSRAADDIEAAPEESAERASAAPVSAVAPAPSPRALRARRAHRRGAVSSTHGDADLARDLGLEEEDDDDVLGGLRTASHR